MEPYFKNKRQETYEAELEEQRRIVKEMQNKKAKTTAIIDEAESQKSELNNNVWAQHVVKTPTTDDEQCNNLEIQPYNPSTSSIAETDGNAAYSKETFNGKELAAVDQYEDDDGTGLPQGW
eukprot:CAMPEP_0201587988 /NCGR_PEP_ID=MMETSP0190_2-20130828/150196_1 /ASSEMBLY_ACC=CAM_ASM_000263 /TAXON_ID=37353 /ORGANISM="Rosalina sp." /LENGTH=120 /DNA_ID=CAMNT_0048039241 /DNA_START=146 /DNA_END=505 /DNA_ORIENTATION=-